MITETMTINGVVRRHPDARPIFETFGIDWTVDGDCFLDELCWWRGLDVEALLEALRQVQRVGVEGSEKREAANV